VTETDGIGDDMQIELTEAPTDGDIAALEAGLAGFNRAQLGPSDRRSLALLIRDEAGEVVGGLSGFTARGWLMIDTLFVPEAMRGQGVASELLALAEKEAQHRGCHGAWLDTLNPQARRLYERRGYASFGELQDLPKGHTLTFMQKALSPTGQASSCSSIAIE